MAHIDNDNPTTAIPDSSDSSGTQRTLGAYDVWKVSTERHTAQRTRFEAVVIFGVGLLAFLIWAASTVQRTPTGAYAVHVVPLVIAASLMAICASAIPIFLLHYNKIKTAFLDDWRRERIYDAIDDIEPDDVKQLILLNQRRMDQYHQMTLSQGADAWRSSQLAMAVGLLVLVGGVTVAITTASSARSQLIIGGLAAIGSALSGYVTVTFLQARRQSLSQLNYYFRQPLATSFLLTAERIAAKIPDGSEQSEVWKTLAAQIADHAFDSTGDSAATPLPKKAP